VKKETNIITGISNSHLSVGAFGLIAIAIIFSLLNRRCPNCNKYLGKKMNSKYCASCGVE
jgi:rRNA maturation endonuclease Nob1